MLLNRFNELIRSIRDRFSRQADDEPVPNPGRTAVARFRLGDPRVRQALITLAGLAIVGYVLYSSPPVRTVERGDLAVRSNVLTGTVSEWRDGRCLSFPVCTKSERTRFATRYTGPSK